jgi:hypothetical protein
MYTRAGHRYACLQPAGKRPGIPIHRRKAVSNLDGGVSGEDIGRFRSGNLREAPCTALDVGHVNVPLGSLESLVLRLKGTNSPLYEYFNIS